MVLEDVVLKLMYKYQYFSYIMLKHFSFFS